MDKERIVSWGTIAVVVALLVLAGSITYVGFTVSSLMRGGIEQLEGDLGSTVITQIGEVVTQELKDELVKDLRREALAFIHAYRKGAQQGRELTREDVEAGYKFADKYLQDNF